MLVVCILLCVCTHPLILPLALVQRRPLLCVCPFSFLSFLEGAFRSFPPTSNTVLRVFSAQRWPKEVFCEMPCIRYSPLNKARLIVQDEVDFDLFMLNLGFCSKV